ncbi:putative UDP-Gal or UDP-GlcNAc-dependent glycosyltransferase [Trypanosoma cruzi]|nr:putative UDP-Gal or UDP-GlcNAc-dependent glycosyltransferase [Trypanosoma cruzi]
MYCLIICCVPGDSLCTLRPNDVKCVIDRPVLLPALDPRAERCGGGSGRPLCWAADEPPLGARGVDVRVRAGPPMNNVYGFVLFSYCYTVYLRLGDGWDLLFLFFLRPFPRLSPHLAVSACGRELLGMHSRAFV